MYFRSTFLLLSALFVTASSRFAAPCPTELAELKLYNSDTNTVIKTIEKDDTFCVGSHGFSVQADVAICLEAISVSKVRFKLTSAAEQTHTPHLYLDSSYEYFLNGDSGGNPNDLAGFGKTPGTYQLYAKLFDAAGTRIATIGKPFSFVECNKAPAAVCRDVEVCHNAEITAGMVNSLSTDSDGVITSRVIDKMGPFGVGASEMVTLTVTDNDGSTDTCMATVTTKDCRKKPVARCKAVEVCSTEIVTVADIDNGSSDADGTIVLRKVRLAGPYPAGSVNRAKLVVRDNDGLVSTCFAAVKSIDCNDPPVAECKNLEVCQDVKITAGMVNNMSTDTDGLIKSRVIDMEGPFGLGVTKIVTLTVTDDDGATDTCESTVTTKDCRKRPVARCKPVEVCSTDKISVSDIDNGSSDIDGTIVKRRVRNNGPFPANTVNRAKLVVTDNDGLKSRCFAKVTSIECNESPIAKCRDLEVCHNKKITAGMVNFMSSDSDGVIVSRVIDQEGPFGFDATKTVTLTVTDNNGATDMCESTVTTKDCRAPLPPCPDTELGTLKLYNAETNTLVQVIQKDDIICRPKYAVTVEAEVIQCQGSVTKSVKFVLSGADDITYIDNGPRFFLNGGNDNPPGVILRAGRYHIFAKLFDEEDGQGTNFATIGKPFKFKRC